ncbi:thiopeptide-type bacteriocin biosynthesis protein [Rathayibacter toxicus]|uniref:thiopeptide-type bacteriocin biosynthesis protein n=1 Tax=Rathayibacter toxicus TaxID=145458 RepID=UPI001C059786|nr:thiopeptide-type bacteriocin biosynthesis protein [Rathayibacter toxicus]QWL30897.1 hypothetical protein E2R34_09195 [Rathayibacter toxicus]
MSDWRCWELRTPNARPESGDRILKIVVAPLADGHSHWFFLRYWNGGAHIRLRVRIQNADEAVAVEAHIRRRYAEYLRRADRSEDQTEAEYRAIGRHLAEIGEGGGAIVLASYRSLGVYAGSYSRELDRYGGEAAMQYAELCFIESSKLAMAMISGNTSANARAALLTQAAVSGARTFARTTGVSVARSLGRQTRIFGPAQERFRRKNADPIDAVVARLFMATEVESVLSTWLTALKENIDSASDSERGALSVLLSQVHMTANRLGLPMSFENRLWNSIRRQDSLTSIN